MIDTHCHLDHPAFARDRAEVLARSRQAGVTQWVIPGVTFAAFPDIVALRSETIHPALGLHPLFIHPTAALEQLAAWVEQVQPVAIGEIGLDYLAPVATHAAQRELFRAQLYLAQQWRKPVLLHVRRAHDEVLAILRRHSCLSGGIVHAFNGSLQQAQHYIDLGFLLGFGGVVTQERAVRIRRVAAAVPETSLVLESDAPDLPPAGHLGERNEPSHLPLVASVMANLRHVSQAQLVMATRRNARILLGLEDW